MVSQLPLLFCNCSQPRGQGDPLKIFDRKCDISIQNPLMIPHLTLRAKVLTMACAMIQALVLSLPLRLHLLSLYKSKWPAALPLNWQQCSCFISFHLLSLLMGTVYSKITAWPARFLFLFLFSFRSLLTYHFLSEAILSTLLELYSILSSYTVPFLFYFSPSTCRL